MPDQDAKARRIQEIQKRLKEYDEHLNDPYSYDLLEIEEVRNFHQHAASDIKFLLEALMPNPQVLR